MILLPKLPPHLQLAEAQDYSEPPAAFSLGIETEAPGDPCASTSTISPSM